MSQISPNSRVLDLAGGTGDVTALFASKLAKAGNICLADYSQEMIKVARDRMLDQGLSNIDFAVAQAESLPCKALLPYLDVERVYLKGTGMDFMS